MARTVNTCLKCGRDFLQRQVVSGKFRNLSKRKFCLSCSPFGHLNRRDLRDYTAGRKRCSRCNKMLPSDQFYQRGRGGLNCWCKACYRGVQRENARRLKIACVEYKGGQCQQCGYKKCLDALEFHHRDPKMKDIKISSQKTVCMHERLRRELDKCDLLCSNCHREVEARVV